jgi:hypothetical protein
MQNMSEPASEDFQANAQELRADVEKVGDLSTLLLRLMAEIYSVRPLLNSNY